jgi:hypothetical protein
MDGNGRTSLMVELISVRIKLIMGASGVAAKKV